MTLEATEYGIIQAVTEEVAGDELDADVAAGGLTLTLGDALDFNEDGGQLLLGVEVLPYASADLELNTIELTTGPAAGWPAETPVEVYPQTVERIALVQLDLDGEAVEARVPHALFDRLPLGTRDGGERVSLGLDGGEWVLGDLLGQQPVVDGSYIVPETLPPVEPQGPTEPPASSPALSAVGSVSAITLVAEGVVDPSTVLDYFMDGVLIETTRSTVVAVRAEPDGDPLDPDLTYDFWVVARNDVGAAAASPTVSSALNLLVDTETILATVTAGFVLAGQIQVGNITIDPDNGIVIPLDSGGEIRFPADGSPAIIDAILRTNDLAVQGGLTINGVTNYVNGKLFLASGTANPQTLLDINWVRDRLLRRFSSATAAGTGASGLGRTADGAYWGAVFHLPSGSEKEFVVISDATGAVVARVHSDDANSDFRSVAAIGQWFYVLGQRYNSSAGTSQSVILRYNTSGVQDGGWFPLSPSGDRLVPVTYWDGAIAADPSGTSLWFARTQSNGRIRWLRYGVNSGGLTSNSPTEDVLSSGVTQTLARSLYVGSGDFGSQRFVVGGWNEQEYGAASFLPDGTWSESDSWATTFYPTGLLWDTASSRFISCARDATSFYLTEFSPERTDTVVFGQYTWYDNNPSGGNKESAPSPINSRIIPRRTFPLLAVPAPPKSGTGVDDPNAVRVYLNTSSTTKLLTTVTSGAALSYISPTLAGTGAAPPGSSTFTAASATGELASASGVDYFRGTGAFNFGGIRGTGNGLAEVPDGTKIKGFVPTGSVTMFAGSSAPSGWLKCEGQALNTATNPDLFAVLGYTFGGSGTTFYVPDLRRRFPLGVYGTFSADVLGANDGITDPALRDPKHDHTAAGLSTGSAQGLVDQTAASGGAVNLNTRGSVNAHTHNVSGDTGDGLQLSAVNPDRQFPYIALNFIIKT